MTTSSYKGIMFILDGLGDRPVESLRGKTPLEAANTPHLDSLITKGMGAMVDPLVPGVPVDTHTGTGLLLGIPVQEIHRLRRGPIEAAGAGIVLEKGDIALRCNFATVQKVEERYVIKDRRAGRLDHDSVLELAQVMKDVDLGSGVRASIYPATQHRAVLRLKGPNLSDDISDSDPMSGQKLEIQNIYPHSAENDAAVTTANALNNLTQIAYKQLMRHPLNIQREKQGDPVANGIICRGAGEYFEIANVLQYLKVKAALVTGDCTIAGLGRLLDFSVFSAPGYTALADTDIGQKIHVGIEALRDHDIVFIHIKAADICSHDFDPMGKRDFLERFDSYLSRMNSDGFVVAVGGDHSTNSRLGDHCGDPVPSLLYSPHGRRDSITSFGESTCQLGGLNRISSTSFLLSMLNSMGKLHNYRKEDSSYYSL